MNKNILLAIIALATLAATSLKAQTTETIDPEVGGRAAIAIDKKLARGLHLQIEEEVRMDGNFASFDRFHTTVGLTYKLRPDIKLGFGYAMINPYSSANQAFKSSRHRLMLDGTYSLRFGQWRLSLKERVQATLRTGSMNTYQNPRVALALKSRLKITYKGLRRYEPYAAIELRNTLNAPVVSATYNGTYYLTPGLSQYGDPGWFLDSYSGIYINRLRGTLGVDIAINRTTGLGIALMADYVTDKVIDANSTGTKLKSYTREHGFRGWLTASYSIKL